MALAALAARALLLFGGPGSRGCQEEPEMDSSPENALVRIEVGRVVTPTGVFRAGAEHIHHARNLHSDVGEIFTAQKRLYLRNLLTSRGEEHVCLLIELAIA